ncbi:hypothetical protein [Massilia sp. METH4]|uniref:hypothetical protein n=1 Tax=Massilia sp. METH4 TaxID=3123041 RepID=UPI0030D35A74
MRSITLCSPSSTTISILMSLISPSPDWALPASWPMWKAAYLLHAVEQTINTELVTEIMFIRGYDQAKLSIRDVVDMPNARLDMLIKLLYQNNGTLSKGKRLQFEELTDEELARIEAVFQAAFTEQTLDLDGAVR